MFHKDKFLNQPNLNFVSANKSGQQMLADC